MLRAKGLVKGKFVGPGKVFGFGGKKVFEGGRFNEKKNCNNIRLLRCSI